MLYIINELTAKGVRLEFIDTPELDVSSPEGELILTILGAVATMERRVIRQRQAEGIAIAKASGKYERNPKLDAEVVSEIRRRVADGVGKAKLARDYGVSRTTIYKVIKGEGVYGDMEAASNGHDTPSLKVVDLFCGCGA